jgi:hypothetical protein
MVTSGSVYGFGVRSSMAIALARPGGVERVLEVGDLTDTPPAPGGDLVTQWRLRAERGEMTAQLYARDGRFEYWSGAGVARVDPARGRIELPDVAHPVLREELLWGVPSVLCFLDRGDLSMHAAAVEIEGRAVLLAAPGRFGKTTLALAFHRAGYRVLSEDVSCCRVSDQPLLFPGPALLRVRTDVLREQGVPTGVSVLLRHPDRTYLSPDAELRGTGGPVPLGGIMLLRQSDNVVRAERLAATVTLADLWALAFRLPGPRNMAQTFEAIARLAGRVPVWNLYRPMVHQALDATVACVASVATVDSDPGSA